MQSISASNNPISKEFELEQSIAEAWDGNVELRSKELFNATDDCYINIIQPWVLSKINEYTDSNDFLLDIGCGCGYLTNQIYLNGRTQIIGIDISKKSIAIAKSNFSHISFAVQNFCSYNTSYYFDLCIAVMVLNNFPDINKFLEHLFHVLNDDGKAIIVIPHPCFWPTNHIKDSTYYYLKEKGYNFKFSTKKQKKYPANVFYFHRPLEVYFECFKKHGFVVERVTELPEVTNIQNPDIIGFVIKKNSTK
jgi:2-polyprenyl-3-methyl-5-hydroxy-6-metoxy-1,4-benzoquinol methylase